MYSTTQSQKDWRHMFNPLYFIRYMLILLPAIGSMYLESYSSYGSFTFFALLLLFVVELRRSVLPSRYHSIALLVEIGFSAWLSYHFEGIMFLAFFSTLLSNVNVRSSRHKIFFIPIQFGALNLSLYGRPPLIWATADLMFITLALLLLYVSSTVQDKANVEVLYDELRRKHYELDEARVRLMDYAKQVEGMAQVEERNRISRDIHDDLGHKLIRLKMMMEAAIHILPTQQEKGMEMIHTVKDQLTESMELMRTTVRRLKPDERVVQSYSLEKLIEDFGKENGIRIRYEINGLPYPLYPSLEIILYRNAQEAITNAIRHGSATEVTIKVSYEPKQVIMQVFNNGILAESNSKGLGLSGMEERTKLVGGKLMIAAEDHFTITTLLPTGMK
jgi:two-component system, NarL family, sensor kinase